MNYPGIAVLLLLATASPALAENQLTVDEAIDAHLDAQDDDLRAVDRGLRALADELGVDYEMLEEQRGDLESADDHAGTAGAHVGTAGGIIEEAPTGGDILGGVLNTVANPASIVAGGGLLTLLGFGVRNKRRTGSWTGRSGRTDDPRGDADIDDQLEELANKIEERKLNQKRRTALRTTLETSIDNGGGRR